MNELILSASSLSAYQACPQRWYLSHVARRPEAQNVAAVIGTATHAGVEALHRGKGSEAAQEAVRASWALEAASVPAEDLAADPGALEDALKMLAVYEKKALPAFHPDLIEWPFTIRVHDVQVTGTIDAADTREDIVEDLKTTDSKNFRPAGYRLQMSIYSLAYWVKTGRWPKELRLRVLTRKGTTRQTVLAPDYGEMRDVIETVRDGIERGDFQPSGAAAGKCHFCPFRLTCSSSTYERVA